MNQPSLWERLAERQQSVARPTPEKNEAAQGAHEAASARLIGRRYRLANRIGRGRFGPIYAATDEGRRDLGIEARVAVQVIDERFTKDPRIVAELTSVYAALSASAHPNIVRTLETVRDGRALFVVTELLEGLSLDAVLDEVAPEPLPFDEAAAVLLSVGDALRNLHAKGYVYGQLKPKNVFVTFEYGIKLIDVAPVAPPVSMPHYVEDMGKQPVSRHTSDDVFELACLAYEMLSGRHPFNENSPVEAQRVGLEPAPLPSLDPRRWEALARALALQRAARTPTVQRFLDELGLSGHERIRAAPHDARMESTARRSAPPAPAWASSYAKGDLGILETMPLDPRQRRRLSVATLARSLFGIAVVVTLGGFALLYYGDLRDSAADLLALVEQKRSPLSPVAPAAGSADAPEPVDAANGPPSLEVMPPPSSATPASAPNSSSTAAATPPSPTGSSSPTSGAATTTSPALSSGSPAATPSASAGVGPSPAAAEPESGSRTASNAPLAQDSPGLPAADVAPPATRRAPESEPSRPPSAAPSNQASSAAPRPRSAEAPSELSRNTGAARTAQPEFPFAFAAPTMTVSETDRMVRVEVRRLGPNDAPGSVVWWLGNATATEDDDYGKLGQHTERFDPGDESRTLYIPLIDDKDRERTESFYVYLGRYSPQRQHLDALESLRIDINDDD